MSQTDPLDDWLSKQPTNVHRRVKRLMEVVREAYPIGVPALIVKSQTDRLGDAGGYSFHLGTPDVVLRRICSWLLTHGDEDILVQLIPELWRRGGREDLALAALLLANLSSVENVWVKLGEVVGTRSTAEALLLSIEECLRAKHEPPSEALLIDWCQQSLAHSHLALLVCHAVWIRAKRPPLSANLAERFKNIEYPDGDSLLVRVRDQILD